MNRRRGSVKRCRREVILERERGCKGWDCFKLLIIRGNFLELVLQSRSERRQHSRTGKKFVAKSQIIAFKELFDFFYTRSLVGQI